MTRLTRCPVCSTADPSPTHVARCQLLDTQQERVRHHATTSGIRAWYALDMHAYFNSRFGDPIEAARLVETVIDLGWRPTIPEAKEQQR